MGAWVYILPNRPHVCKDDWTIYTPNKTKHAQRAPFHNREYFFALGPRALVEQPISVAHNGTRQVWVHHMRRGEGTHVHVRRREPLASSEDRFPLRPNKRMNIPSPSIVYCNLVEASNFIKIMYRGGRRKNEQLINLLDYISIFYPFLYLSIFELKYNWIYEAHYQILYAPIFLLLMRQENNTRSSSGFSGFRWFLEHFHPGDGSHW